MRSSHFSPDIREFIRLLSVYKIRYVIVGGEAVIYYGFARLTGAVDFFYEATAENVKKLYEALIHFWKGKIPGLKSPDELLNIGTIFQFGVPPNRIDILNSIDAVAFDEAWKKRTEERTKIRGKEYPVYYIGLEQLIKNKKSMQRFRDLEDLKYLNEIMKRMGKK